MLRSVSAVLLTGLVLLAAVPSPARAEKKASFPASSRSRPRTIFQRMPGTKPGKTERTAASRTV